MELEPSTIMSLTAIFISFGNVAMLKYSQFKRKKENIKWCKENGYTSWSETGYPLGK